MQRGDCCIAKLATEQTVELLHRDRDFSAIAAVSGLLEQYLRW